MRTITIEEHFATPEFFEGPGRALRTTASQGVPDLRAMLLDTGDGRLQAMDEAHIDAQGLSLTPPGVQQLSAAEAIALARSTNDALASVALRHQGRFFGLAAVPTIDPKAAVDEVRRAHDEFGMPGVLINGHTQGRYLDDSFFWPILAEVERLRMPVYLHPTAPPQAVLASYGGNYSPDVAYTLATTGWGWHIETAQHALRLILSGALDRFPALQVVIGHLGEGLPFLLPRFDDRLPRAITGLQRPISSYLRENFHYAISGFNWLPAFLDLMLQVGSDRICFSADYPFASMAEAMNFLASLPISDADRERIAHGNAGRLYGLMRSESI